MSIDQASVVDAIGVDNSTGEVVLTITDHLKWEDSDHLLKLQEKINTYLSFVESGEVFEVYPKAKDRQVLISVVCKFPPDEKGVGFLSQVTDIVTGAGILFSYKSIEED